MSIIYETKWSGIHAWDRTAIKYMPHHAHDYVEIMYILRGEICYYVNFEQYTLRAGDAVFVFPGQIHGHEASSDNCRCFTLLFPKGIPVFDGVFTCFLPKTPVVHIDCDKNCIEWFEEAHKANEDKTLPYAKGIVSGYISLILGKFLPSLSLCSIEPGESSVERRLIDYCSAHYKEQISLSTVASALGYSTTYISHLFSNRFKSGFSSFISTMRIEEAKKMLRGDKKITRIAFDCGLGSMRNFNRVFKETTGLSPTDYRAAHRNENEKTL